MKNQPLRFYHSRVRRWITFVITTTFSSQKTSLKQGSQSHFDLLQLVEKKSSFLWYIRAIGGHCTNSMKSLLIYANLPAKL